MIDLRNATIKIENSTLCNANCIMCPRDEFNFHGQVMSLKCFIKLVDESYSLGCRRMILGGFGEPLLDNNLGTRLRYVKNTYIDYTISLITTGYALRGEVLDDVCEFIDVIKLSNYGYSPDVYESVHRGKLHYDTINENISGLLCRKSRPYTIMTFLVVKENEHEVEQWKQHYEHIADRIDIWKPHNWGGLINTNKKGQFTPCRRALSLSDLTFSADGSVVLCCFDFNRKLRIGNITEQSLEAIINGDKCGKLQYLHRDKSIVNSNLLCASCDQLYDRTDSLIYTSNINMQVGKNSMQDFKE